MTILLGINYGIKLNRYTDVSDLCQTIFQYYDTEIENMLKDPQFEKIIELKDKLNQNLKISYVNRIQKIVKNETNNLVLIQPVNKYTVRSFLNVFPSDFVFFPYTGMKEEFFEKSLGYLEDIPDDFKYYKSNSILGIFDLKIPKKDNIIVKLASYKFMYYPETFGQFRFPELVTMVTFSLLNLEPGGNLILSLPLVNINTAYEKIFKLLANSFETYNMEPFNYSLELGHILAFEGFQDNIDNNILKKLKDISGESLKYSYETCDYFDYVYSHPEINYYLENLNYKKSDKKVYIIDDIDIEPDTTKRNSVVIERLVNYFETQMDVIAEYLNRNILEDEKGEININKDFFERTIYDKLIRRIRIADKNNILTDKSLLIYLKKYNKLTLENFFKTEEEDFQMKLDFIKFKYISPKYNLSNYKTYTYSVLNAQQLMLYKERYNQNRVFWISKLEQEKIPKSYESIVGGYNEGLQNYIKGKYDMKVGVDFINLWEVYSTYPEVLKQEDINVLYLGENTSDLKKCLKYYLEKNKLKKQINECNNEELNQKLENPTSSKNITSFKNLASDMNINFIVCSVNSESESVIRIQKFEFSKSLVILSGLKKGGSCMVKHSFPYNFNVKNSEKGNGFFVNLIFLYYLHFKKIYLYKPITSDIHSTDFYLIGENFSGVKEEDFNIYVNILKFFEENFCFYEKDSIPDFFIQQLYEFMEQINDASYEKYQQKNVIFSCLGDASKNVKEDLGCTEITDQEKIDKMKEKSMKKWIKFFNF